MRNEGRLIPSYGLRWPTEFRQRETESLLAARDSTICVRSAVNSVSVGQHLPKIQSGIGNFDSTLEEAWASTVRRHFSAYRGRREKQRAR